MKKITLATILLALCFATGFTCSKNAPQQVASPPEAMPPADMQNQMAAPPESATVPAAPQETAPTPAPAPVEAATQPATVTK